MKTEMAHRLFFVAAFVNHLIKRIPKLDAEGVAKNYHDHAVNECEHKKTGDQLQQSEQTQPYKNKEGR
jgi:hypothetical protein